MAARDQESITLSSPGSSILRMESEGDDDFACLIGGFIPSSSSSSSSSCSVGMLSSASSIASTFVGDCIGSESCLDLKIGDEEGLPVLFPKEDKVEDDEDEDEKEEVVLRSGGDGDGNETRCYFRKEKEKKKSEFPPPITVLARTGNLASHMPWVLTREYTSDGRLILREEKVWRHEYFRAHRCNGRLTLQLVPLYLDHDHNYNHDADESPEVKSELDLEYDDGDDDDDDDDDNDENDDDDDHNHVINESGAGGKCLDYNNVVRQSSTSILGVSVPA